jgi:hypothetical protein
MMGKGKRVLDEEDAPEDGLFGKKKNNDEEGMMMGKGKRVLDEEEV